MQARMTKLGRLGVTLAGVLLALCAVSPLARADVYDAADWAPSIWSDKADYRPGEMVTLSGANWQPGEAVHIVVNDDAGRTWSHEADVSANGAGAIADSFNLPDWFVAEYSVRATGASGAVANAGFTDGNVGFELATVDQDAAANLAWKVDWTHYKDSSTCGGTGTAGSTSYAGNSPTVGSSVAVGNGQSARPTSVVAAGYALAYWSSSATSTTPLTAAQLCKPGPGNATLYAHFDATIRQTTLTAASASGGYGGTATLSATLASGGAGVGGKSVVFRVGGTNVGTATTNGSGIAILANASLAGIDAGAYATGVSASFAGDTGYSASSATAALTVTRKSLTAGFTAAGKVYDGSTEAAISGRSLTGVIGGDDVTLSGGSATFADKAAGDGKTVTGTGFALTGADEGNYALASSTLTTAADITPKLLTGGFTAADKVYDGNRVATVSGRSLPGVIGSDEVGLDVSNARFDTKDVGAGKTVTADLALSGADAGNYSLSAAAATTTAEITSKSVSGSFTADDKVYDGDRVATVSGRSLPGVLGSDDVALEVSNAQFDSKHVGTGKTVTADLALSGADKGNYSLDSATATATADVTARELAGHFTADDKVYDGTTAATISGRSLSGVIGSDDVSLSGGSATFASAAVGADKTVTGTGFALAGADTGDYSLASSSLSTEADITPKPLTGGFTAADKVYDGTTAATVSGRSLPGVLGSDDVVLAVTGAVFATKDVGAGKTVTADLALSGADEGNYALTSATATATAAITAKPVTGGFTAADKVYDGTTAATVATRSLAGKVDGDAVDLVVTNALFGTPNVGAGKTVTADLDLSGADEGNYALASASATATADITAKSVTGSFTAADKVYDGTTAATITTRSLAGVVGNDAVSLVGGTATFADPSVGLSKTVTGTGFVLGGDGKGNYSLASSTLTAKASIAYRWDGFLQPINDTAHQTGATESKFKLGQTIPAKFQIKNALGTVIQQAGSPAFSRSANLGPCDATAALDAVTELVTPDAGVAYTWDGTQYHYNWSTKGLTAGEYRIYANLADGTKRHVDICLTK